MRTDVFSKAERDEIRTICESLRDAGISIPDKNEYITGDAGGGCLVWDHDGWYDAVVGLYDEMAPAVPRDLDEALGEGTKASEL